MNITNFTFSDSVMTPFGIPSECYDSTSRSVVYNMECMINNICPHIDGQMIRNGIIIIVAYVIVIYTMNWYLNIGYKRYPSDHFDTFEKRASFDFKVRNHFTVVMLAYIAIIVYLNSSAIDKNNFIFILSGLAFIVIVFKIYVRFFSKTD